MTRVYRCSCKRTGRFGGTTPRGSWLVAAARRTPFRGPWQKPPFVRAYAVGEGAVTPPRSQNAMQPTLRECQLPLRKTLLPRALRLRCQAHIAPRIAILDLGYAVQRRPVSLIVGLRNFGVLFWRVVGRLIFRRKRHPRWLLRMSRGGRQCDCHDCGPKDSHRASSSHRRRDKPPQRYKRIHQKAIARAVEPARCRPSDLRMDQKVTPRPTKPTQTLELELLTAIPLSMRRFWLMMSYH
jgi:hypothetical protein